MPMAPAVVGRQPIVNRRRDTIGYELLFRSTTTSTSACDPDLGTGRSGVIDGDTMSATVVFNTMSLGIERVTGSKTMFCNADRGMLTGRVGMTLPPEQTVIEVLETVDVDDEVLTGCRELRRRGYRLAADDFEWYDGAEKLLELVHVVKIDLRRTPLSAMGSLLSKCRAFEVQLLAEKVETADELDSCLDLGFDLFQGYYLGRPHTISDPTLGPSRHGLIRLAQELLSEDSDLYHIEDILRSEPALSYRLLQLAAVGRLGETKRNIRSIREALVALGLERARAWLPAMLLQPAGHAIDSALPSVLSRARLAELLAARVYPKQAGFAFAAGMMSAFDLLLGIDADQLPSTLQVPADLRDAAFGGTMTIGRLVSQVKEYQLTGTIPTGLPGIDRAVVDEAAAQAFGWAIRMAEEIDDAASEE